MLEAVVIRYRRERWCTPSGASVVAPLPPGLAGGFGPHFRTGTAKSRLNFLELLRAGHEDYVIDDAALTYMRTRALASPFLAALAAHPVEVFADAATWKAHLIALGFDARAVTPDPVRIATEGALRGAIQRHGLLPYTVDARTIPTIGPVKRSSGPLERCQPDHTLKSG